MTVGTVEGLVERLRAWPAVELGNDALSAAHVAVLMEEAADRIEQLEAECERAWESQRISHEQAMSNGEAAANLRAQLVASREALEAIADKNERQAACLEKYAESNGFEARSVPSVFHLQAQHFRDFAQDARRAALTIGVGD